MLVGFHGYAEDAGIQLARLCAVPGSQRWLKVSIQALNRFYDRRTSRVVACWMTRQDRDLAIADNLSYINHCLDNAAQEWETLPATVFTGFSQGVAMAFRAAVNTARHVAGVIAVGGDVPPELSSQALSHVSAAIVARGSSDNLYTKEQFAHDAQRLRDASVIVRSIEFPAGHEWSGEITAAAADFLREID
jgi:predicted esterase